MANAKTTREQIEKGEISQALKFKISVIEKKFGLDWLDKFPKNSVDQVYRQAIDDRRVPLYSHIRDETKRRLRQLTQFYEITMGELIEVMVDAYYEVYEEQVAKLNESIAEDYSGKI